MFEFLLKVVGWALKGAFIFVCAVIGGILGALITLIS